MTNRDIINYILNTPHNTNPAILMQHLEQQDEEIRHSIDLSNYVKTINNIAPDEQGNVTISIPDPVDLTGYATETYIDNKISSIKVEDTAMTIVSSHNVANDAHNDIRLKLTSIDNRLTAFFNSDETTLDDLAEIVAYITANKSLIESVTTTKVNIDDIVNDLITDSAKHPLSASQGVALKSLIDSLDSEIDSKVGLDELTRTVNEALLLAKNSGEFTGPQGEVGPQGPQGEKGERGETGPQGEQGPIGPEGVAGPQGEKGEKGDTGPVGATGAQGPIGPQGEKGETGATGETGPKGEKGEKGDTGADGKTPVKGVDYFTDADKVEIIPNFAFSINMISAYEQPSVTVQGTYPDLIYVFNIPMGNVNTEPDPEPEIGESKMWIGYLPYDPNGLVGVDSLDVIGAGLTKKYIDGAVTGGTLKEVPVSTMSKTSIGIVPESAYACCIYPADKNFVVTIDNGIGGKERFNDKHGEYAVNDILLNTKIDDIQYKVSGFLSSMEGERFFYVD